MALGKLPVPGRATNLDKSRARAYCTCSRCGWVCHFFLSPSLWETARYRLKYCLKGHLSPKPPTNQPPSSEFNAYLKQIKVIFSAVKKYRIFSLVTNTIYIFSM